MTVTLEFALIACCVMLIAIAIWGGE